MKIGTKKELITKLLTEQPYIRDWDQSIIAEVWRKDLEKHYILGELSAIDLLCIISGNSLTNPESIRRTRQKIQQHNPNLRGEYYNDRSKQQAHVRKELKDWNNEQDK